MTWILISAPLMLLAVAIAVLPVMLSAVKEARVNALAYERAVPVRLRPAAATRAADDLAA